MACNYGPLREEPEVVVRGLLPEAVGEILEEVEGRVVLRVIGDVALSLEVLPHQGPVIEEGGAHVVGQLALQARCQDAFP